MDARKILLEIREILGGKGSASAKIEDDCLRVQTVTGLDPYGIHSLSRIIELLNPSFKIEPMRYQSSGRTGEGSVISVFVYTYPEF